MDNVVTTRQRLQSQGRSQQVSYSKVCTRPGSWSLCKRSHVRHSAYERSRYMARLETSAPSPGHQSSLHLPRLRRGISPDSTVRPHYSHTSTKYTMALLVQGYLTLGHHSYLILQIPPGVLLPLSSAPTAADWAAPDQKLTLMHYECHCEYGSANAA